MGKLASTTLLTSLLVILPVGAQDWVAIRTDRFDVVSQLSERDTRQWAEEFSRFVDALHGLLPLNQNLLPPLTAVLFRRSGGFAPYRIRTESGVVGGNRGVFINYSSWSIIGMPGQGAANDDASTTYHEAVHWFMSADPARYPLWFGEGIAEVFSTFDTESGVARWGQPIDSNLRFLQTTGLQPLQEFLLVTQDQAMHVNATYYSQAWLFVHYLLFGRLEDGPALLGRFLTSSLTMSPADAFRSAFDVTFEEMDGLLRAYLRSRRFNVGRAPLSGDAPDIVVTPAPDALVELSLARLAFGTGNDEPLRQHLERLVAMAPDGAEAYDLRAAWALRNDSGDIVANLDAAIARGSRDPVTYRLRARDAMESLRNNEPLFSSAAYAAGDARQIADLLMQAAGLQPTSLDSFRLLSDVLFSVGEIHESDREILEIGAIVHAKQGIVLIAQAAVAVADGNMAEAARLIDLALTDDFELGEIEAAAAGSLRGRLRP